MILTEKLQIKMAASNINYYKNKGYSCKVKDVVDVKIEDLSKGSTKKIKVKCDVCGKEKTMEYRFYYKSFIKCNFYSCSSACGQEKVKKIMLNKYGVDNYSKTEEYNEKCKKTNLEKYGVEYPTQNTDFYEKIKETNLKKYGTVCALQNTEINEKTKITNLKKYGVEHNSQNKEIKNKKMETSLANYGVEYPIQNCEIKEKIKKIKLEKYGVEHYSKTEEYKEKFKNTCMERYDVENPTQNSEIYEKSKKTCLFNYGVEYPTQNFEIKEKIKKINLERYGAEYPLQNLEIFNKVQKSAFKLKKYKNYLYRGTYELDFLIKFSDNYKIEHAKTIDYVFDGKNKKYHPDYYLPDYNLIVEIKSTYIYEREKEKNEAKKEAAINSGYNFIFIIDKDYTDFLSIL